MEIDGDDKEDQAQIWSSSQIPHSDRCPVYISVPKAAPAQIQRPLLLELV
jgi:hypothetical protein